MMQFEVIEEKKEVKGFELNADIVAGSLTTNALELKAKVENELENYTVDKYLNDIESATTDKAKLNKVKEAIATKRKEITKQWNKPLDEFLETMKSIEKVVDDSYQKINTLVKQADDTIKGEKKKQIQEYFDSLNFTLIPLDRIFNPKWLNKTCKINTVFQEISDAVTEIKSNLTTLESMKDEDADTLKAFYLETLDLKLTLQKGNQLKETRAKLKAAEKSEEIKTPERKEIDAENEKWKKQKLEEYQAETSTMSFTLKLFGTKEQLIALRKYIDANGIRYEKL